MGRSYSTLLPTPTPVPNKGGERERCLGPYTARRRFIKSATTALWIVVGTAYLIDLFTASLIFVMATETAAPNGIIHFQYPFSPYARRVIWYLQLRGIAHVNCVGDYCFYLVFPS